MRDVSVRDSANRLVVCQQGRIRYASVKALDHQLWEAWRNNDLTTIKMLCAADYVSDDGGNSRQLSGGRTVFGQHLSVNTSKVSEPAQSCCRQRVGKAPREGLSIFVHEVPMKKPQ